MGFRKQHTVILERLISLTLADLRGLKFFDENGGYRTMPVSIKRHNGLYTESYDIQVTVSLQSGNAYVLIECAIDELPVKNRISLVQEPNYLTGEHTYYFQCPETSKRCRKLFMQGRKWVCREAIPNRYYLRDTLSKHNRGQYKTMKRLTSLEKTIATCGRKYFKVYNKSGQHTSRMKNVIQAKNELDQLSQLLEKAF